MLNAPYSAPTQAIKIYPYDEYYIGKKDQKGRRLAEGENHWTGAESIEWYTGRFLRDMMHGYGDYRWRHCGEDDAFVTYEGLFYANAMHGYGVMSYPDGRVFTGLYHGNIRWGPGVESHVKLRQNVGLWRGTQLVRLAWRPVPYNVAPDLAAGELGKLCVEPHRVVLRKAVKTIGETNSALDLLKEYCSDPMQAAERWTQLYPKHCTDQASHLCHKDLFENDYYNGKIRYLEETTEQVLAREPVEDTNSIDSQEGSTYYAWNNNEMFIHMMKHTYKHEGQRRRVRLKLEKILNGPRKSFRPPGDTERSCRTLLMASYLGYITSVTTLVNEEDVYPNVADIQGNTALIYAVCGDQRTVINFLVEAGANVNSFNDSCCTPLGIALVRYLCAYRDIGMNTMTQALLPPVVLAPPNALTTKLPPSQAVLEKVQKPTEWMINREITDSGHTMVPTSTASKLGSAKKYKSTQNLTNGSKKKNMSKDNVTKKEEYESDESLSDEMEKYGSMLREFSIAFTNMYCLPTPFTPIPYLFEVNDMVKEVEACDDAVGATEKVAKKTISKHNKVSNTKYTSKISKDALFKNIEKEYASVGSLDKLRCDVLAKIMTTILQLLEDGADPKLVRCPQPALFMAAMSESPDLLRYLINRGADVNEKYPQTLNYTALDVAASMPLSAVSLEMIRTLLEEGADATHRLQYADNDTTNVMMIDVPGPTLLHAVLAKKLDDECEEDFRRHIIELLLDYNCNPTIQFKGTSAIDFAMTKRIHMFGVFIKHPKIDLNAIINDANQSVLSKMFSLHYFKASSGLDRCHILTDLLLYGADPLLPCQDVDVKYPNLFVYAKQNLANIDKMPAAPAAHKEKGAGDKSKSAFSKMSTKADDINDYKQAIDLVTECARLLHIRWLQGKLVKELMDVICKYKHRPWSMIIKEHEARKSTGLWLTPQRCLEVWNIMKSAKKKQYNDDRLLKHLLCIVMYYSKRTKVDLNVGPNITTAEKGVIESDVILFVKEHKMATKLTNEVVWHRPYVKPELACKADEKFNVCFECAMPLDENAVLCIFCKLVSFCSMDCMKSNVHRVSCHPCSDYLQAKYFTFSEPSSFISDRD